MPDATSVSANPKATKIQKKPAQEHAELATPPASQAPTDAAAPKAQRFSTVSSNVNPKSSFVLQLPHIGSKLPLQDHPVRHSLRPPQHAHAPDLEQTRAQHQGARDAAGHGAVQEGQGREGQKLEGLELCLLRLRRYFRDQPLSQILEFEFAKAILMS
ncbi:hypothetical protein H0H92_005584, partial [Tricholoma furcatifolium]